MNPRAMNRRLRRTALTLLLALTLAGTARAAEQQSYQHGGPRDPGVQAAQFMIEDQRYFETTIDLLALQAEHSTDPMSAVFERHLARAALYYGVPDWARVYYRELIITTNHTQRLAQGWLMLALFDYQRARPHAALKELQALKPHLPDSMKVQWEDLASRVQLSLKHYDAAIKILTSGDDADQQTPFMRYNLGIAYLLEGTDPQG
jgi:hypothetical protein